jgi:SAM-dependent methyltransferase
MLEPFTRQLLLEAGIAPGRRVLDVGSGIGDTAFLAAELVGRSGEVLGTDRAPAPLKLAEQRAAERSLSNVSFPAGRSRRADLRPSVRRGHWSLRLNVPARSAGDAQRADPPYKAGWRDRLP